MPTGPRESHSLPSKAKVAYENQECEALNVGVARPSETHPNQIDSSFGLHDEMAG